MLVLNSLYFSKLFPPLITSNDNAKRDKIEMMILDLLSHDKIVYLIFCHVLSYIVDEILNIIIYIKYT